MTQDALRQEGMQAGSQASQDNGISRRGVSAMHIYTQGQCSEFESWLWVDTRAHGVCWGCWQCWQCWLCFGGWRGSRAAFPRELSLLSPGIPSRAIDCIEHLFLCENFARGHSIGLDSAGGAGQKSVRSESADSTISAGKKFKAKLQSSYFNKSAKYQLIR